MRTFDEGFRFWNNRTWVGTKIQDTPLKNLEILALGTIGGVEVGIIDNQ